MRKCTRCGSYAINPHAHGRDSSDLDLCDVCYWRKRAEFGGAIVTEPLTDKQLVACIEAAGFKTWDSRMWELKRQIEHHYGIKGDSHD